ncbi:NUDIX domain-containing protein [Bacillus sp. 1P06AnD]|uniref:NUDIX domain-containing protein n=1 Tax=Bacillus sp. 1P06AnD TaxID=3132208 RepID=UPI0039A1C59B
MRDRSSIILIQENKVALIKRIRNSSLYYVFPGGGIEEGETAEEAAEREAFEELGVEVKINRCFAQINFNGTQSFFLAEQIGGTFGTGKGDEYKVGNRGIYVPLWINVENICSMDVRPWEVAKKISSVMMPK